jgi:hypothetical protein
MVAKRHDLICVKIEDNRESDLTAVVGLVGIEDLETKETITVDTPVVHKSFKTKKMELLKKKPSEYSKSGSQYHKFGNGQLLYKTAYKIF